MLLAAGMQKLAGSSAAAAFVVRGHVGNLDVASIDLPQQRSRWRHSTLMRLRGSRSKIGEQQYLVCELKLLVSD